MTSKEKWSNLKKEILQNIKNIDENMVSEEIQPFIDPPKWWVEMMGVYDDLTKGKAFNAK